MKNVQVLVKEMFKVQNNFSTEIMKNFFPVTEAIHNYNRRETSNFTSRRANTVHFWPESLSYLGPRLWTLLPDKYKKDSKL